MCVFGVLCVPVNCPWNIHLCFIILQISMSVSWATGCAGTVSVSTWSAATSAPVTRVTSPLRAEWNVSVCTRQEPFIYACFCWAHLKPKARRFWSSFRHRRVHHRERRLWDLLHQLGGQLRVQLPQRICAVAWSEKLHWWEALQHVPSPSICGTVSDMLN